MRVLKWLDKNIELLICSLALIALFVCMILATFFRYIVNSSLTWVEELGCYLFIWFSLVGVAYSTKEGIHLRVDVFVNVMPKPIRVLLGFVSEIVLTAFFCYMSVEGMKSIISIMGSGTTSPALRIPMWIVYTSFWLGCVLSLIRLVQRWIKKLLNRKDSRKEGIENAG